MPRADVPCNIETSPVKSRSRASQELSVQSRDSKTSISHETTVRPSSLPRFENHCQGYDASFSNGSSRASWRSQFGNAILSVSR